MISRRNNDTQRGFTLVELIVSIGLFALVMLIATGAYFSLIALDKRARATGQVVSNLSFAMDTMARGIRTGANFKCITNQDADGQSANSTGGCDWFSYTDTGLNTTVTYIRKVDCNGTACNTIGRCVGVVPASCTDAAASSLTDPAITIQSLKFYVRGVGNSSAPTWQQQPHVTFTVSGTMPAGNTCRSVIADTKRTGVVSGTCSSTIPFTLQEGATQRIIDY